MTVINTSEFFDLSKKFILNADDFGISTDLNRAVLEAYKSGILKSVSLMANGMAFDNAIDEILPQCQGLGVGVHLNLIEGKSLRQDITSLVDPEWKFKNTFLNLLFRVYNPREKDLMDEIEREFRLQIEKVLSKTPVTHIDSHVHIHAIPKIFDLVCRLAKEYGIKQVRTQFEKPYIIPDLHKHLTWKYPLNIIKSTVLGFFTLFNDLAIHKYGLKTNDYLIGITYTSMMDGLTVSYGLKPIKYKDVVVEALIHPRRYEDGTIDNHFDEFLLTKNKKLKAKIENLGFEITNYVEEES